MTALDPGVQRCRDSGVYPVPIERVFDVVSDLTTYDTWWTMIRTIPLDRDRTRLEPGVRFRIEGNRPGGNPTSWLVEVLEVDAPRRIELSYAEGALVGSVAWELDEVEGGTSAAYVYHGVRATTPSAAATFVRYGTRLHSEAMRIDALAGLGRFLAGEPMDEEWEARVQADLAAAIAALPPNEPEAG